jgi:drug/metabolite transporter (DMT)-like permease
MSAGVMVVVLLGAALHASWNAVVKSGSDKFIDTVLVTASSAILAGLVLPFLSLPAPASWPYAGASVVIHVLYFSFVAAAYRISDMSFAYPLMRGSAPLIVALLSAVLVGERLSPGAWTGVLLICGGVLGLTLAYRRPEGSVVRPTLFALTNAGVIAGYTFVDGVGVRLSGQAAAYTLWVLLLTAFPIVGWAAARRVRDVRQQFAARWHLGLFGGGCMLGSYALVLWAMTKAPITPVAALRETSIVFGMAFAALVLKEPFGWTRRVAAGSIALGAIALRLA